MTWALGALLSVLAVAGVALPWWRPSFARRRGIGRRSANVAAYRGRIAELARDVEAGLVPREQLEALQRELDAHFVEDAGAPEPAAAERASRALPALAGVALLAFGAAWYALDGSWRTQRLIDLARTSPELARAQSLDRMIGKLREQVAEHPDDAEAWAWLARSYRSRENFADAAQAFARAGALKGGQDPDLLAEEGEALAFTQDRRMAGAPAERFAQALALAPDHGQALWYSGIAALQAGDDRAAIAHWERLSRQALPDDFRQTLDHSLAQLRERNGIEAPATAAAGGPVALQVSVSVAPALAAQVQPGDTLFVYAVDPAGPPMPLAVQRLSAGALPARVTLDDSMGPMPTRKLSSVSRWRVVARVSRAGTATPQSGDLEGSRELERKDAGRPIEVVIDRVRP